jgi:hypothetical protein
VSPNDLLSLKEASMYLSIDESKLSALAAERRTPCHEQNGSWVFSKKSIDKWRGQQRPS